MKPSTRPSHTSSATTPRGRDERGFVLAWAAIMLTVLMGFAGLAVDVGNWYLKIQRTQRVADSAALDGAPHLPGDPAAAIASAKESLKRNHVEQRFIDSAVIKPVTGKPTALYVRVTTENKNTFLKLLGVRDVSTFTRAGTATWQPKIEMGNFSNVLGTEPPDATQPFNDQWETATARAAQRQYWLSVSGPRTWQGRGDQYASQKCTNPRNPGILTSGCQAVGLNGLSTEFVAPPTGGQWASAQYTYTMTVRQGAPGSTVKLQVFDPAYALTGPYCKAPYWGGGYIDRLFSATNDPRHNPANTQYCAGDHTYTDAAGDDATVPRGPTTYFRVYNENNQPQSSCAGIQSFPAYTPTVGADYRNVPGLEQFAGNTQFRNTFHRWVNLCTVPTNPTKDMVYRIQVWTNANTEGLNHYSLRAGLFNGTSLLQAESTQFIRLSADERLPLYSNFKSSDMRFAIAEVPMGRAGTEVKFSMFDVGDCYNCTAANLATFKLESDSVRAGGGSPTASCTYTPLANLNTYVPLANCTLGGVWNGSGYNGKRIDFKWQVPSDYQCGLDVNGKSCFLFMHVDFAGGSTEVDDQSTWTLDGKGIPLRLITNPTNP